MNQTIGSRMTPDADQHCVYDPGLALEHEPPEQRRDDGRDRPRHQHRRPDQAPPLERAVEGQRQPETDHQLEADAGDRKEERVPQRADEPGVPHRVHIVGQSDERPPQPRHPEIVQMQRFPEGPGQRKQRDQEDGQQRRQDQPPGQPRLARFDAADRISGGQWPLPCRVRLD